MKTFKLDKTLCTALHDVCKRTNRTQRAVVEAGLKREIIAS